MNEIKTIINNIIFKLFKKNAFKNKDIDKVVIEIDNYLEIRKKEEEDIKRKNAIKKTKKIKNKRKKIEELIKKISILSFFILIFGLFIFLIFDFFKESDLKNKKSELKSNINKYVINKSGYKAEEAEQAFIDSYFDISDTKEENIKKYDNIKNKKDFGIKEQKQN